MSEDKSQKRLSGSRLMSKEARTEQVRAYFVIVILTIIHITFIISVWVFLSVCVCVCVCVCTLFWPDSSGKRRADMRRCEALPCDIPWHLLLSNTHTYTHMHAHTQKHTHTLHPPFIQSAVLDWRTPDGKSQERRAPPRSLNIIQRWKRG